VRGIGKGLATSPGVLCCSKDGILKEIKLIVEGEYVKLGVLGLRVSVRRVDEQLATW